MYYDATAILLLLLLLLFIFAVWICSIYCCARIAQEKRSCISIGLLVFIGIFTPIVVLPIIVAALPDRGAGAPAAAPRAPASPASPASSDGLGLPSL